MPKVITKRSAVPGKVPLATDLEHGELAINTSDKKLFSKDNTGSVFELTLLPDQKEFLVGPAGQDRFTLDSAPANDVVILSLNGLIQHEYAIDGLDVVIDPPAIEDDEVLVTWMARV